MISDDELAHFSRLALAGRKDDISLYVRRMARKLRSGNPKLAKRLRELVSDTGSQKSALRREGVAAMPVDTESRLQLARCEYPVELDVEPIWHESITAVLDQIKAERNREADLIDAALLPTKSLLFTGPPGVGKTLAARRIAQQLDRPLLVLDLSAVMSSFLGRTGNNLRNVLDYAKGIDCVLLLDEFDAIAKRRDDAIEVGELKRLVTVLLQEIDEWPSTGILISATNHSGLLDPAVWRRFDIVLEFPMPSREHVKRAVHAFLGSANGTLDHWHTLAAITFEGASFSDIKRDLLRIRREAVVFDRPLEDRLEDYLRERLQSLPHDARKRVAVVMWESGYSQREAQAFTGISRDTIRKESHNAGD